MKNSIKKLLVLSLVLALLLSFTACGSKKNAIKIAVPNDSTNEARALKLLEAQGVIKLKDTKDALATVKDIAENPNNVEFVEAEAAQVPSILKDVTYAVINSNYAIEAGLTPFVTEGTDISYPNVLCVKEGNENLDKIKALVAALNSKQVEAFIKSSYKGAIVCDLVNPGNGFDDTVDYAALKGTKITVGATPVPHADILAEAKKVLAEKDITLEVKEFNDYVLPNTEVNDGNIDANFFAHIPYQQDFNEQNGTKIKWILEIHHEPMGVYSNTYSDWSGLTK